MAKTKKTPKHEREIKILLALVDLYLKTGRPIGSQSLKDDVFEDLSSATIRNYFAKLEASGFLRQQHSSGGRIPTDSALRLYAMQYLDAEDLEKKEEAFLKMRLATPTQEVARYLASAVETISTATGCAAFISTPRFDQDVIVGIKLVELDIQRCLCILMTQFGLIRTEILPTTVKLDADSLQRIELYFRYRLTGRDQPLLKGEEENAAKELYTEILLRHIVGHAHFTAEDLFKAGFSKLLAYPEFQDASALAGSLSLFENKDEMRNLLRETCTLGELKCWIGEDLGRPNLAAVIAAPYSIHGKHVGAVAIMGPPRIDYPKLFALMHACTRYISDTLTVSLYKNQITYRQPEGKKISHSQELPILIEDQRGHDDRTRTT